MVFDYLLYRCLFLFFDQVKYSKEPDNQTKCKISGLIYLFDSFIDDLISFACKWESGVLQCVFFLDLIFFSSAQLIVI